MKISTNSGASETPASIESQADSLIIGKKPEPTEVEKPKTFLEQLVEDHRNPAVGPSLPTWYEPISINRESLEIQKAGADKLDSFVDALKETPLGTIFPNPVLAVADDVTDVICAGYNFLLDQDKSITDLVLAAPESAAHALDRANERLKGDSDIQLTLNPTMDDILHTMELWINPESRSEVMAAQITFGAEMLIEALPVLETVMGSNTARTLDKLTDIGAKLMDKAILGLLPNVVQVVAGDDFKPASSLVQGIKDGLGELSTPEGIRGVSRVFTDPSSKILEELEPGSFFTKRVKLAADIKGNELGQEVSVTIEKTLEGRYRVTVLGHGDGATGLKDGELDTGVTVGIGSGFMHVYEMDDPRMAAAMGRGDFLAAGTRLITGDIDFKEIEIHWDLEADGGIGPLSGKTNIRAGVTVFDPGVELQVTGEIALDFDEFKLVPGVDVKTLKDVWDAVKPDSGFDGKAQVQTTVNTKGEVQVGISFKSVDGKETYELKGELTIDVKEAAQAVGVTVEEFKKLLKSGELNPATWWQAIPKEAFEAKLEFTQTTVDGISPGMKYAEIESAYHIRKEHFSIDRDGIKGDPQQVLSDLRSAKAKEQQLERLRV